ncbi:MAG: amidohydrolase family protein [Rubricoccaceae bacterium]|nr:amidohydrolase family protein [Rubricoccaceae bacterium]
MLILSRHAIFGTITHPIYEMRATKRLVAISLFLLSVPLAFGQGINAETPLRPVTRTFAITNARVVQAPGRVLDQATVVIRDGVIESVGANVEPPVDAQILEGDSLTIYAGFIDAFSHVSVKDVEEDETDITDPGDPSNDRAGIMPQRDVRTMLKPDDGNIGSLRNLGFTVAHVAPDGNMLPGRGVAILLREPQRMEDDLGVVLTGPLSLYAQFEESDGVYPGTDMGILAKLRDLFIEAGRRQDAVQTYFDDPEGRTRPAYNPVLAGLTETLDGDLPIYFRVESTNDAFRALNVTEELNIPMVLVGLPWSTPVTGRLSARNVAAVAPLALPDTVATDTTASAIEVSPPAAGASVVMYHRRAGSHDDLNQERAALRAQQAAAVGRYEANAATLQAEGIRFAFSTYDVETGDIRKNLRRMIAAGLSENDALAALTTTPADLLHLPMLGTVEGGKMANLVVTDGNYFEEDTKVRFVFVEGVKYEAEEDKPPEGADPDADVDATGTWSFTVITPGGEQEGTFTITGSGSSLAGTIQTDDSVELQNVTLEGNVLSFSFSQPGVGAISVSGVIDENSFSGTATVASMGSFTMTATRPG